MDNQTTTHVDPVAVLAEMSTISSELLTEVAMQRAHNKSLERQVEQFVIRVERLEAEIERLEAEAEPRDAELPAT